MKRDYENGRYEVISLRVTRSVLQRLTEVTNGTNCSASKLMYELVAQGLQNAELVSAIVGKFDDGAVAKEIAKLNRKRAEIDTKLAELKSKPKGG